MIRAWPTILLFLVLFASPMQAGERVAFVVGNADYENTSTLANPIQDARLISATLEKIGFSVTLHQNLTRNEFSRAFSEFLKSASGADIAFFYFAGHGVQLDGTNYLLGTDTTLQSEFDVISEGISLDDVGEILARRSKAALIFVDACRDNPLANTFFAENFSQSRSVQTRGLAPMASTNAGSMLVFAASPGQVAYDGSGANSPFSLALARHLPTPGAEVLSLMKRVISDVRLLTNGRQSPTITNDLARDIFLAGQATILQDFEAASASGEVAAWDQFLSEHLGSSNTAIINLAERLREEAIGSIGLEGASENEDAQTTIQSRDRTLALLIETPNGASVDASEEDAAFQAAKTVNTPRAWAHFFSAFPKGQWAEDALEIEARIHRQIMRKLAADFAGQDVLSGMRRASIEFIGLTRSETLAIQSNLERLGYQPGAIDGVLGDRSFAAIAAFQSDRGLLSDGIVDRPTLASFDLPSRRISQSDWFRTASPVSQRYNPAALEFVESDRRVIDLASAFPNARMTFGIFDNRLYAVVRTNAFGTTSEMATALAQKAGGELAKIDSREENSFIIDLFRFDSFLWEDGYNGEDWLAGPSIGLFRAESGSRAWQWQDGTTPNYSAWLLGFPKNQGSAKVSEFRTSNRSTNPEPVEWGWADNHSARRSLVFEIE